MTSRLTQWLVRVLIASSGLCLLLATANVNATAPVEEVELKAAFIYNFTLFTVWPQARGNLNLCVMGDGGYVDALSKYGGRKVLNGTIHVQKINSAEDVHACEVLFLAGIRPTTQAGAISKPRAALLHGAIRQVLAQAVAQGGSTLRDFSNAQGEAGHFQLDAKVYGRAGLPCRVCAAPVKSMRQGQRSTFYCVSCQKA